jgi:hypothetical protein
MSQAKAPAAQRKNGTRDVPERIGKYPIINEVGQGSTGRVFLSHDCSIRTFCRSTTRARRTAAITS